MSLLIAGLCFITVSTLNGATLVLPQGYDDVEGGGVLGGALEGPRRKQLIFGAESFAETMPQGGVITAIALRLDGKFGDSVNGVLGDFEVRVGTTPSLMLSTPFLWDSKPAPSDQITVFPRGRWEVRAENLPRGWTESVLACNSFRAPIPV